MKTRRTFNTTTPTLHLTLTGILLASSALADDRTCIGAYQDSLRTIDQRALLAITLQNEYSKHCGDSSRTTEKSFGAELNAVVKSIPVVAGWADRKQVTNRDSFCKAFLKDETLFVSDESYSSTPVIAAQSNFNQCIRWANNEGVVVTHETSPGSVVIHFDHTGTETDFEVQGVVSNTFACSMPTSSWFDGRSLDSTSRIKVERNFNIICKREAVIGDGKEFYSYDEVIIGTNVDSPYKVIVSEETVYGPALQSNARREIDRRDGKIAELNRQIEGLEGQLAGLHASHHFFYVNSGPKGLSQAIGDNRGWQDALVGTKRNSWRPDLKERVRGWYCPDAEKVQLRELYRQSGNCCGNVQFMVTCLDLGETE